MDQANGLYLRLSVTDRCNFWCQYCRPDASCGATHQDLDTPSLVRLISQINAVNPVIKVRLTGGEPLLRRDLPDLARRISNLLPGVTLGLTTNGSLLARHADALAAAGVQAINVSLDTVDPELFSEVTGGGDLAGVLEGLEAARRAGVSKIKINAVLQRRCAADDGLSRIVEVGRSHGAEVRFIELMPMGHGARNLGHQRLHAEDALSMLARRYHYTGPRGLSGTSSRHMFTDGGEEFQVGLITPISQPFCDQCNRIRLDSRGRFYDCLRDSQGMSLTPWINDDALPESAREAIRLRARGGRSSWPSRSMISTGG